MKITSNDTTAGYLLDKLTVAEESNSTSIIEWKEINDGGDEDLKLAIDESKINHDNLEGFVANEHIDWTQSGAGTIDPSNYVDNNDDEKAKVSANDTTAGYLFTKIQAGTNVTIQENNDGGNETMTISATGELTADCPTVQIRRTTDYSFTETMTDLTFNVTDVENKPDIIEHDNINTDRILIKEDGVYRIDYNYSNEVHSQGIFHLEVRKNDAVILPGKL